MWEVLIFPGYHHLFLMEEDRAENGECPSKHKVRGNIHTVTFCCSAALGKLLR